MKNISIIIPTTPTDTAIESLLLDLQETDAEIIISSEGTRAKSLNKGVEQANGNFLWFLHADSRITQNNLTALQYSIAQHPDALHYFNLKYDGGIIMRLNSIGANLRSRLLGLPFGDQGFCLSKKQFEKIGGYPEDTPYGEDVLFIRHGKKKNIKLQNISSPLETSARKYTSQGWLKTTLLHQWFLFKLLRKTL